ncbi:hypothetical protein [Methylomonas fluvii]|uniref:Tetratricopeptide repeat protein n=1 Tax=Methylomonas fluvii TaxID=1854564 RepID=A0ABR9D914_9GAMM|nr:hypothetical protein [Methylomonas fluvii]MBD9359440.1 hypothetical protein [Methylomonas fluvii]CAD6872167.1 hypothetical protein [Methylomonas fluvii]
MKKIIQKISAGLSESSLPEKAQAHYAAGRYKEASDLFKELLKQSGDAETKRYLADCYLQRARGMAAKAMFKEACVLWENYAANAQSPLQMQDVYQLWLLAGKNERKAYAILDGFDARQLDEELPALAVYLGALLVSGATELLPHLPQDSALLKHWQWASQALAAYRNGEREGCEHALKPLPFRSAFRDLRTLLKVQLLEGADFEQAPAMLAKIPDESPYQPLAKACLAYRQSGADFLASLSNLEHNQRRIVAQAKGLNARQSQLLEALVKLNGQLDAKTRFNLVLQYRDVFGNDAAQAYCLGALAEYPGGEKDYFKHFASKDPFEENRLQALLHEQAENAYDAGFFWQRCIDILKQDRPANDRKIALILRRMADKAYSAEAAALLADSLEYDPDDRQSYLKLLTIYQEQRPNMAQYEHWLERGLQRFPSDTDLLVRAAKSAAARKAFKKAAAYAKALLQIDPVNTLAKQLLFANHMAHARRLVKAEKFHLVEKEIQAAEQLTIDKSLRRQAELLRGFYLWQAEDKAQGLQRIADTLASLYDDPVNMHVQAQIEAGLLELPTQGISRALPAFKDYLLSAPQLQRLIGLLNDYDEQLDDNSLILKALDKVKAPLKKSVEWLLDHETLLLAWCQALESIGHFELLKHCAKTAQARRHTPALMYYRTLAECQGDASHLDFMSLCRLEIASAEARADSDNRTAGLIARLLERARGGPEYLPMEDEADDFDQPPISDDPIEDLFGHIPDAVFARIEKKIEELVRKRGPEQFVANIMRQYGNGRDEQNLAILFMNQDFLWCVTVFAAAEELKLEIGVGFDDIIARFNHDSPQYSLPFN